jgi:hypothetical protein
MKLDRQEIIDKTNDFVKTLNKIVPTKEEVVLCKTLHSDRITKKDLYNKKHPYSLAKESKISRNHSDGDLWWGLLGELVIAKEYGGREVLSKWYDDQVRQNNKVLINGIYDCKDIGHTQIRAAEYNDAEPRRVIYRENDFRTKSCQPVVGCIVNTVSNDIWVTVCGFMSWEDLKKRKQEFWGDPDGRGYYAMWIPFWELTPMNKFNFNSLL